MQMKRMKNKKYLHEKKHERILYVKLLFYAQG